MKKSKIALTLAIVGLLFSCASLDKSKTYEKDYRLTDFTLFDGENRLLQTISIDYNEMNKPALITTRGENDSVLQNKLLAYTNAGKISYQSYTDTEGQMIQESSYVYDDHDFLISVDTVNSEGHKLVSINYRNDERGNPVEWNSKTQNKGEEIHFLMDYDGQDRLIKSTELDREGNRLYYSTTEYNEQGKEIAYTIYSADGEIDQQLLSSYKRGRLSLKEVFNDKGSLIYKTRFNYDSNDLLWEEISENSYGDLAGKIEHLYDEEGQEIETRTYNHESKVTQQIKMEYDEMGNVVLNVIEDGNGQVLNKTVNVYSKAPLTMDPLEFNSLVFRN